MEYDNTLILALAGSIIFLGILVWLMHKEGSSKKWQEISSQARSERAKNEKK